LSNICFRSRWNKSEVTQTARTFLCVSHLIFGWLQFSSLAPRSFSYSYPWYVLPFLHAFFYSEDYYLSQFCCFSAMVPRAPAEKLQSQRMTEKLWYCVKSLVCQQIPFFLIDFCASKTSMKLNTCQYPNFTIEGVCGIRD